MCCKTLHRFNKQDAQADECNHNLLSSNSESKLNTITTFPQSKSLLLFLSDAIAMTQNKNRSPKNLRKLHQTTTDSQIVTWRSKNQTGSQYLQILKLHVPVHDPEGESRDTGDLSPSKSTQKEKPDSSYDSSITDPIGAKRMLKTHRDLETSNHGPSSRDPETRRANEREDLQERECWCRNKVQEAEPLLR